MEQKLWLIELKDGKDILFFDVRFEITEYDVFGQEGDSLIVRNIMNESQMKGSFFVKSEEKIEIREFPWTYTRDFSKLAELKAKIFEARMDWEDKQIDVCQKKVDEHKELKKFFDIKKSELLNAQNGKI